MNQIIEIAAEIAQEWHCGQVDKGGTDYFEGHLSTVAAYGKDWQEKVVGYLHDAAEDTNHSVADVMDALRAGVAGDVEQPNKAEWAEIEDALNIMNHNTAANREEYIERFRGHDLAIRVKLNDLRSNMNLSRIPNPMEKDFARRERYLTEFQKLRQMLDEIENQRFEPEYFLHRWNAEISSFTLEEYRSLRKKHPDGFMLNWSLWDWQKACEGDVYFMMRVDGKHPGIVFYGDFYDDPWEEESWRGDGKMIHYMDIVCRHPAAPTKPLLSLEQLTASFPEIDWLHGHSGVLLTREQGEKLLQMLNDCYAIQ